jgi:hypothetical protein
MRRLAHACLAFTVLAALLSAGVIAAPRGMAAAATITFDDRIGQDQPLNGQYPAGVVDWGTGAWFHSGPWGAFSTKSVSFADAATTARAFTFLTPRRLVSLRAFNGGTVASSVTLRCAGQVDVVASVAVGQVLTINSGWTSGCTTVTISSSNG